LDKDIVEYLQDKVRAEEEFDFDNFILNTVGSNTDKEKHFLINKFPEILKKKELPPLANIDLHNKIAKIAIRGMYTEDDYILMYLISKDKVPYKHDLLEMILHGLGYTSRDQLGDEGKQLGLLQENIQNGPQDNGKIKSGKQYEGPPPRTGSNLTDPYKNLLWEKSSRDSHWDNPLKFNKETKDHHGNWFGSTKNKPESNRFSQKWFDGLGELKH